MENPAEREVATEVVAERGTWNVYLIVTTPEGVERRLLQTHRSERQARLAADALRRAAARRRAPREETDD